MIPSSYELKWYDSVWLQRYYSAKDIIRSVAPEKLEDFMSAFKCLRTEPAFNVKAHSFADQTLQRMRNTVRGLNINLFEVHEIERFGRIVVHDHPEFTDLQSELVSLVSELAGEPVEPSYNFLSLYSSKGKLEPHLDAPSAKWTLDICIDQSEEWPIHLSQVIEWPEEPFLQGDGWAEKVINSPTLHFDTRILTPGNAILFSGSSQWHYRHDMPRSSGNSFCNLLFMHFIPAGTKDLVQPRNWADIFGVPELNGIPEVDKRI